MNVTICLQDRPEATQIELTHHRDKANDSENWTMDSDSLKPRIFDQTIKNRFFCKIDLLKESETYCKTLLSFSKSGKSLHARRLL